VTTPTWTPPEADRSTRPHRPAWVAPALVGAAAVCGCAAVALVDPADTGTSICWSKSIFGVDCPLCGATRAVNSMVRGDWAAAADHNLLFVVAVPVLVAAWVAWLVSALRHRPLPRWVHRMTHPSVAVGVAVAVVLVAFAVVRNVGGPEWADWLNSAASRS
jgi:hypothetical protein